jgi:hypothetical protein
MGFTNAQPWKQNWSTSRRHTENLDDVSKRAGTETIFLGISVLLALHQ